MRFSSLGLILGATALIFLGIAGWVGVLKPRDLYTQTEQVAQLPLVGAHSFADRQIGDLVAIEGTISPRNPALFREYAAYYRQEYRGDDEDGDPIWREDQRDTPRLLLVVADGTIQIANNTYELRWPLTEWLESERLSWNIFSGEGTKRYYGVLRNDSVFAVGVVVSGNEGPELQAEYIVANSRAGYVSTMQNEANDSRSFGMWFGGLAAVLLILAVVAMIRDW
jgi:hypothetical protein